MFLFNRMHVEDFLNFIMMETLTKNYVFEGEGGHQEKQNFANVVLGNFELYIKIFSPNPPHHILPVGMIL